MNRFIRYVSKIVCGNAQNSNFEVGATAPHPRPNTEHLSTLKQSASPMFMLSMRLLIYQENENGRFHRTGKCCVDIFGGGSADWAREVASIRYTYLIELRDTGARGFQLPVDEIAPTGIENWEGLRELAAHVLLNHGRRRRPTAAAVSASFLAVGASTHGEHRTPCWTSASAACRCRRPTLIVLAIILIVFLQRRQRSYRAEVF